MSYTVIPYVAVRFQYRRVCACLFKKVVEFFHRHRINKWLCIRTLENVILEGEACNVLSRSAEVILACFNNSATCSGPVSELVIFLILPLEVVDVCRTPVCTVDDPTP
jgi:hypothetical protein